MTPKLLCEALTVDGNPCRAYAAFVWHKRAFCYVHGVGRSGAIELPEAVRGRMLEKVHSRPKPTPTESDASVDALRERILQRRAERLAREQEIEAAFARQFDAERFKGIE